LAQAILPQGPFWAPPLPCVSLWRQSYAPIDGRPFMSRDAPGLPSSGGLRRNASCGALHGLSLSTSEGKDGLGSQKVQPAEAALPFGAAGLGGSRPPCIDIVRINQDDCHDCSSPLSPSYFSDRYAADQIFRSMALSPFVPRWVGGSIGNYYTFDPGAPLGEGSFGKVFGGTDKKSRARVAIKMVCRQGTQSEIFKRECEVAKQLDHPSIIRIYDIFSDARHWYIAQELCEGGELRTLLQNNGPFAQVDAACAVEQIASALLHLHQRGIVFRDLKNDNVLLKSNARIADNVRVVDFGMAVFLDSLETCNDHPPLHIFAAPEIRKRMAYSVSADVWSLGILAYECLCGLVPDLNRDSVQSATVVEAEMAALDEWELQFTENCQLTEQSQDFLKKLLQTTPSNRMTAREALQHAFISDQVAEQRQDMQVDDETIRNLLAWPGHSKFKRAALTASSHYLHGEPLKKVRRAFAACDTDRDGTLSWVEFAASLCRHCPEETGRSEFSFGTVIQAIASSCRDDGGISFAEFVAAAMDPNLLESLDWLAHSAFRSMDKDADGVISEDDLANVMESSVLLEADSDDPKSPDSSPKSLSPHSPSFGFNFFPKGECAAGSPVRLLRQSRSVSSFVGAEGTHGKSADGTLRSSRGGSSEGRTISSADSTYSSRSSAAKLPPINSDFAAWPTVGWPLPAGQCPPGAYKQRRSAAGGCGHSSPTNGPRGWPGGSARGGCGSVGGCRTSPMPATELSVEVAERLGWGSAMQAPTLMKLLKERVEGDLELHFDDFLRMVKEEWKFRSYYQTDVAQASYLVAHYDKAFIVNPANYEIERTYLRDLRRFGLTLHGILVTHCPFEYVSGHAQLSALTGAPVHFGAEEWRLRGTCRDPSKEFLCGPETRLLMDAGKHGGSENLRIYWRPIPTPGHTSGAVTWLLCRRPSKRRKLGEQVLLAFTGGTFLPSGIGRTDLETVICGEPEAHRETMAEAMYGSVQAFLQEVSGRTEVFPSIVVGSLRSTCRLLQRSNPFLQPNLTRSAFLERSRRILRSHVRAPSHFHEIVAWNSAKWPQQRPRLLFDKPGDEEELGKAEKPLAFHAVGPALSGPEFRSAHAALKQQCEEVVMVDARDAEDFSERHVRGSVNFPLHTRMSVVEAFWGIWFGNIVSNASRLFLVVPAGREQEVLDRLQLIGFTNVEAIMGGVEVEKFLASDVSSITRCGPAQLRAFVNHSRGGERSSAAKPSFAEGAEPLLLDVRSQAEFVNCEYGHLFGSRNVPLLEVVSSPARCVGPPHRECIVLCNNGFRSSIACSYMVQAGLSAVQWVPGGYEAIRQVVPELCVAPVWPR